MDLLEAILKQHGYRLERKLGEGAFARVYQVRESGTDHMYACKVSTGGHTLLAEAQYLEELEHPLFPRYQASWEEGDCGFLVMERVWGSSLRALMDRRGSLTRRHALWIARQIGVGLHSLHDRSVPLLYRDLKPEHVMICQDGSVKLLDMGCVCPVDHITSLAGTPGYAAPEQLTQGQVQGIYSDVYAWGQLLRYLLPDTPYAQSLSPALRQLIDQCTAQNPALRPPTLQNALLRLDQSKKYSVFSRHRIPTSSGYRYLRATHHHHTSLFSQNPPRK